jgi:IS5 family transposase
LSAARRAGRQPHAPDRQRTHQPPVEVGYKAQVVGNEDGIVVDYSVEQSNRADAPQLAPAVQRVT